MNAPQRIRVLTAVFDTAIAHEDLSAFRAALARSVGPEQTWFHRHGHSAAPTYPLVQFKRQGQRPMLQYLGGQSGEAEAYFQQNEWALHIKGQTRRMGLYRLDVHEHELRLEASPRHYGLRFWLPFSAESYAEYRHLDDHADLRERYLLRLLQGQLQAFSHGMGWPLAAPPDVHFVHKPYAMRVPYKGIQRLAFHADFLCPLALPLHIGLGKGASSGYGMVGQGRRR